MTARSGMHDLTMKKHGTNFKAHFLQGQNKLWLQQQTVQTSGYTSANAAHTNIQQDDFQCYQDATDALANPTTTLADQKVFKNLSNTIANLTQQAKDKDAPLTLLPFNPPPIPSW